MQAGADVVRAEAGLVEAAERLRAARTADAARAAARAEAERAAEAADAARVETRAQAERAAAAVVDTAAATLAASRARLIEATAAAQAALVGLYAAAAEHRGGVTAAARDLEARGLRLDGDHATGARLSPFPVARLRGVAHRAADGETLARVVFGRVRGEMPRTPADPGLADVLDAVPPPARPADGRRTA